MKFLFLFFLSLPFFTLMSCGSGKTNDNLNADVPQGMVAADLSGVGLNILVNVPDSTVAPLEIAANPQGGADIRVGQNFQMTIIEGPGDIELKKNDITHDDVRKFVKYLVEEPNILVWEWQIEGMDPDFHFYAIIKDGQKSYEVHEIEGGVFSEKFVMEMLDAAKTIRAKTLPAKKDA